MIAELKQLVDHLRDPGWCLKNGLLLALIDASIYLTARWPGHWYYCLPFSAAWYGYRYRYAVRAHLQASLARYRRTTVTYVAAACLYQRLVLATTRSA